MKSLLASDVTTDLTILMDGFNVKNRIVPSVSASLKLSSAIPLASILLSFISSSVVYLTGYKPEFSLSGLTDYFLSDGWIFIAPTLVVGFLFAFMTYNNVLVYLAIPEEFRKRSLVVKHLTMLAKRTVGFFVSLMIAATLLSGYSTWFAFAIPALLFSLLFIINLVVGVEINRLGAGIAIDKISKLVKSI